MKLKSLLIISCLLGAVTILNAQGDTKSMSWWTGPESFWTFIDCNNDGVPEEFISGWFEVYHQVLHMKDGQPVWSRSHVKGEATGFISGDNFEYQTMNVRNGEFGELVTWQFILRSPNAKYTGKVSFNTITGELVFKNIICK